MIAHKGGVFWGEGSQIKSAFQKRNRKNRETACKGARKRGKRETRRRPSTQTRNDQGVLKEGVQSTLPPKKRERVRKGGTKLREGAEKKKVGSRVMHLLEICISRTR